MKSICIFMLLFYFEFFCNCQHELFMKMWIMTVFVKKKKKDCRPLKRYKLLLHFWYFIYNCYFYIQSFLQFLGSIIYLFIYLLCQSRPVTIRAERPSLCVYHTEETALKTKHFNDLQTFKIRTTGTFNNISARSAGLPHTKTNCMCSRCLELRPLSSCSMITSPRGRYDL